MEERRFFPIKYKILFVQSAITAFAFLVFYGFVSHFFTEDKKTFVRDLNLSLIDSGNQLLSVHLRWRLDSVQRLAAELKSGWKPKDPVNHVFTNLSKPLDEELLRLQFFLINIKGEKSLVLEYINSLYLDKRKLPKDWYSKLDGTALPPVTTSNDSRMTLTNRSLMADEIKKTIPVLTVQFQGRASVKTGERIIVVADFDQTFLSMALRVSPIADVYWVTRDGRLLSHTSPEKLIAQADTESWIDETLKEKLQSATYLSEIFDQSTPDGDYLTSVRETGLKETYLVARVPAQKAFAAVGRLLGELSLPAIFLLYASVLIGIYFSRKLTKNISKLQAAAQSVGAGHLDIALGVKSRDEIEQVAESFEWMAKRVQNLLVESKEKGRMEEELKTASLVQKTLLTPPVIPTDKVDLTHFYSPASECSGDFWDVFVQGKTLTLVIADATGHGVSAAIATAVAKSCLITLNMIYSENSPPAEFLLSELNRVVHSTCKEKILLTLCLIQLDLETGELKIGNAGHESPFVFRSALATETGNPKAEALFARGERLGFQADSVYTVETFQLEPNDTLLLYTDGVSEAINKEGQEWGERAMKKAFALAAKTEGTAESIKNAILSALRSFTKGAPQKDDVTFVLLKRSAGVKTAALDADDPSKLAA